MAESSFDDDYGGLIPEELIWEILIWVPVKSLMRFKCVARRWKSIILNPFFARAYRGGFKGVLISKPDRWGLAFNEDLFYLNILDDDDDDDDDDDGDTPKQIFHHHAVNHGGKKLVSTAPTNGLVCFYFGNHSYLYNIATRESLVLPVSINDSGSCSYHLGFDPVKKSYKLLKTCPVYEKYDVEEQEGYSFIRNLNCEILTIGVDSAWRRIDSAPWEIKDKSFYRNGVLYWTNVDEPRSRIRSHLLSFDLAQEKFQFISQPEGSCSSRLLWFGPSLALTLVFICCGYDFKQLSIKYYDDDTGGSGENGLWMEYKVNLPKSEDLGAFGMLPNGNLVIFGYSVWDWKFPVPWFLYDKNNRELHKILITEEALSSSSTSRLTDSCGFIYASYHEENIIPLSCLGLPQILAHP